MGAAGLGRSLGITTTSPLLDRFAKAEKSGRKFVTAGTKKPTSKKEELGAIITELDQIRENLREFAVQ